MLDTVVDATRARAGRGRGYLSRLASLARRHWLILALVGLGVIIRLLVMIAYAPAFWYYGDSGEYLSIAEYLAPHRLRGTGYPLFLAVLRRVGSVTLVVALQHLAGVAMAVGLYAFLRRRGITAGLASLAAAPVLFDSAQVDLEHFILTETLFTTLLVLAVGLVVWSARPGVVACAAAGAAVAGAWLTRPIAIGVLILLGGYLVLRRVGWRQVAAFAAAFLIPYALVVTWVGDRPNVYTSPSIGLLTYGRAAQVADCDRVDFPTEQQRSLCPSTPRDERYDRVDAYTWHMLTPELIYDPAQDEVLSGFTRAVLAEQPGDYAASVLRELVPLFLPWQDLGPQHRELEQTWVLPATVRDGPEALFLARDDFASPAADRLDAPASTGLTRVLHWYGEHVRTPALLNTVALALVIAAFVRARRRGAWPDARDATLLVTVALALAVVQVVMGMYDLRYVLPSLPLSATGAVLAWHALRSSRAPTGAEPDEAPGLLPPEHVARGRHASPTG